MTIATILGGNRRELISTHAAISVRDAITLLAQQRIGAVPVMDGDEVVGVFSERDVIHTLEAHGAAALDLAVGDVMTAPAITVAPEHAVIGALSLMTQRRIRHLPVLDQGRVVGIVSIGDLVKYRIDRIEADAEALRSYIQQA
ncbi:CBS domain-containing protein [Sphingomonas qilianensis]|uniref:CBS domain-containing protein n=1 Tax=Sphingomonas qilianensis TaxID=1736690 RepID=A0ABU9XVS5_9SPHN